MAKQKNGETTEGEAPVKKAPAKSESNYATLQAERRAIEAELSGIDGQIREAINGGDLKALESLGERKAELPKLFIAASVAEAKARQEMFNAEDVENLKALHAAESARDELRAAMVELQQRHAEEIAKLKGELLAADQVVGEVYATINAARDLGASGEAGFKASLAKLAGV